MVLVILPILGSVIFMRLYLRSHHRKYLLAMLFALLSVGLEILFQFFMPIELFYARLGWLKYVYVLIMVLGVLSLFWVCFVSSNPKKTN